MGQYHFENMEEEQYTTVSSPSKLNPSKKRTVGLRISSDATQGGRDYMEDVILVAFDRKENADYACLAVFDGHGGRQAAIYARDHLWENIKKQRGFFSRDHDTVLKAIREGFFITQTEMWKDRETWPKTASGYPSTAGTTVSMAIICGTDCYIAHVGDSRIVMGKYTKKGVIDADVLTRDHKPSSPREIARIEKAGGKVQTKSGVDRVVWTRAKKDHQGPIRRSTFTTDIPFLAVSRSLGDLWSYNYDTQEYIVSPDPELSHHTIDPEKERFLILASDGLWNVASVYDAVGMVEKYHKNRLGHNGIMSETISHKLVKRGMDLWNYRLCRADNITVVTCFFEFPDTLDDEEDQVHLDSVRDWEELGVKVNGEYPQGLSPYKPPLIRRQACPKLCRMENYNQDRCLNYKQKMKLGGGCRGGAFMQCGGVEPIVSSEYLKHYTIDQFHPVKTCNCKVNKEERAKSWGHSSHRDQYYHEKKRRASHDPHTSFCSKKRKISSSEEEAKANTPDTFQYSLSPLELSTRNDNVTKNPTMSSPLTLLPTPLNEVKGQTTSLKVADSPPSPSLKVCKEKANSDTENNESPTRRVKRKSPRRSPRIQAAALTIPRGRRSCRIR